MLFGWSSVAGSNSAAWLVEDRVRPLEVHSAPCHMPCSHPDKLLVKVGAVAVNQVDVAAQVPGTFIPKGAKYPRGCYPRYKPWAPNLRNWRERGPSRILGCDLAGEVVQIGRCDPGGIQVGDRILGLAVGGVTPWVCQWDSNCAESAFHEYVLVRRNLAFTIPDTITYEQASVLTLTMTIAAFALFHEAYLYMCPPTMPPREPDASSDIVIITDSMPDPEYFESVKKLGARRVFDNNTRDLADEILSAMTEDDRTIAGAVAIGRNTVETCIRVLSKYEGGNGLREDNKFVAVIDLPVNMKLCLDPVSMLRDIGSTALQISNTILSKVTKVPVKLVTVQDMYNTRNAVTRIVFRDFLPRALASGHISLVPEPKVVGVGLEKI